MFANYLIRRRDYFEQDIIQLRNQKFRLIGADLVGEEGAYMKGK
tara:strand:- start:425 stop:556 length:132 start_codon:yes stop_codon:yes gene_type:complete